MPTPSTDLTSPPAAPSAPSSLPPLENGDRLARDEFERRFRAFPHVRKAELIDGVVYMPSPVRYRNHGRPHGQLTTLLGNYSAATQGVGFASDTTARLELDTEPQPDVLLMIDPALGGQARIDDDDYVEGAPELVAEVASSSVSYDLGVKLRAYARAGVREYIAWRVLDAAIDWLVLREGRFVPLAPGPDGLTRSEVFPGLWLDTAALLRGDLAAAVAALQIGLASPEHAAFAAELAGRAAGQPRVDDPGRPG